MRASSTSEMYVYCLSPKAFKRVDTTDKVLGKEADLLSSWKKTRRTLGPQSKKYLPKDLETWTFSSRNTAPSSEGIWNIEVPWPMATEEPRNWTYPSPECFKPFFYNLGGSNTKGAGEFGSYFLKNNKTKHQKKKKQTKPAGSRQSQLREFTAGLEHHSGLHGLATHGVISVRPFLVLLFKAYHLLFSDVSHHKHV